MANFDDNSDILGGQLRIQPAWATLGFWVKLAVMLALGAFCCTVFLYIRARYLNWKEERHRLSLRRKYGIPDNDHRPFNVAWAAVQRAQRDKNIASQAEKRPQGSQPSGENALRHRLPASANQDNQRIANLPTWAPRASSGQLLPRDSISTTNPHAYPSSSRASSHRLSSVAPSYDQPPLLPNTYDSSTLDDTPVASRRGSPLGSKRGAKRIYHEEEEEELHLRQKAREKRARNLSLESAQPIDVDEDEEEEEEIEDEEMGSSEDDVAELPVIRRGKKRDRAEAGSTFGGDDSTDDDETKEKSDRQRKRRTVNGRRKSEVHPRGTKRDRDPEAESESEEEGTRMKNTRKKRGKPSKVTDSGSSSSDASMEDGEYSTDVLCGGRRIGEEWEVNGTHFKVGPNGDRLRQALIKKSRSRYSMPKDSVHPDSQANVEVFVEVWLTEDQYQDAKAQKALAWQDSAPPSPPYGVSDLKNSSSVPVPKGGKNLIWSTKPSSRSSSMITRVPSTDSMSAGIRRPLRQSITGNLQQPRVNPFNQVPETPSRRISSVALTDSINNTPENNASPVRLGGGRSYSKWEKQELEAATMRKIRSRLEEAKKKEASELSLVAAPAPAPVSTITFPKPADKVLEKESQPAAVTSAQSAVTKPPTPAAFTPMAPPAPVPSTATPSAPPPATAPNFFATPTPTASTVEKPKPSFTPVAPSSQPAAQPPRAASGGFSFSKPAETPAPQTTPAPAPAPTATPTFAFSAPPQAEKKSEAPAPVFSFSAQTEKKPEAPQSSLLSRLGPQPSAPGSSPAPAQPAPAFSFGKTTEPSTAATAAASSNATSATATATPKFNFGFGNAAKTDSTSSMQTPAAFAAQGGSGSLTKPVESVTTFASTATPSTAPVASPGPGPKFNFGAVAKPASSAQDKSSAVLPSTPVFGATTATTPASFAFGKPAETNGATKSAFSFNPTPAPAPSAEPPKTNFSFSTAPPMSLPGASATTPFGGSSQPASSSTDATKSAFSFGPAPGTTPATTPIFGSSAFGAPTSGAPSAFGTTQPPSSNNTTGGSTTFTFGQSSSNSPFIFGQKQGSK